MSKTAGVVIDDWKLPIFQRHLNEAGFAYTQFPGLTKGTLLLKVTTDWISTLRPVVEAAQQEAHNARHHSH